MSETTARGNDGGAADDLESLPMTAITRQHQPSSRPRLMMTATRMTLVQALAIAVCSRIVLAAVAWISLRAFPRFALHPVQLPDTFFPNHPLLDGWARWDAAHYVAIAQMGYGGDNPSPHGGLGFFPLFPLLMRGLTMVTGLAPTPGHLALAALLIANACFLIAVPLLTWLASQRFGPDAALNTALLVCIVPFSFFFNAAYSESLFFLLCLASLALAGRNRWWAAACFGLLASATRLVGLAVAPALLYLAWRQRARLRDLIGICILSPLGAIAFFVYTALKFDDPLAYFHAQATWGDWSDHVRYYATLFLKHPRSALGGDSGNLIIMLNVIMALIWLAFLPRVWRSLDPGTALFTTLLVVVQAAMTWVSLGRYLLPAFGFYLVAGVWLTHPHRSGWMRDVVVITAGLLLCLLTVLYAHDFWVV